MLIAGFKAQAFKKIAVLTGAGISVSAGIPDFRSPGSGIYANLSKYKLNRPEDLFTLSFFQQNPQAFFEFAKEFDLDKYEPTLTHYFIRLLELKGLLHINLTQNIDNLEEKTGLSKDLLCQAHGSIKGAYCSKCGFEASPDEFKACVQRGEVYRCQSGTKCTYPVKPRIIFFGEKLPDDFFNKMELVDDCDLMIVMGTALAVAPFNMLVNHVGNGVPQVLINRENLKSQGFDFEKPLNRLFLPGNCDDTVLQLANDLGLGEELQQLMMAKGQKI